MSGPVPRSPAVAALALAGAVVAGSAFGVSAAAARPGNPSTKVVVPSSGVASLMAGASPQTAITRAGPGYWLIGGDGGVFPFGRGAYEGGLAAHRTNAPIVGGAVTRSGIGYWLVAADGGVFAFGDALWSGSVPSSGALDVIVGMAATPAGDGYWLVGKDGGVFAFGGARYLGGLSTRLLSAPVVAVA